MTLPLPKSVAHNTGVLAVSMIVGLLGRGVDVLLHIKPFFSPYALALGFLLLAVGFLLRVWTTVHFYRSRMGVIVLHAQQTLLTDGPYAFSRNPLYLGGNVFMFLGAALVLGSPSGVVLTVLGLIPTDIMIRREERQLAAKFGAQWTAYATHVRRWL